MVMDIKVGNGAFMSTVESAESLAHSLCSVGTAAGMPTTALLTDMSQPLANTAGNGLEVAEAIAFLKGDSDSKRLLEVTWALAAENLVLSGLCRDENAALAALDVAHQSGAAAEIFEQSIHAMGGQGDILDSFEKNRAKAPVVRPVYPLVGWKGKTVLRMDTRKLGMAVVALGGGRTFSGQAIDHAVGCTDWIRPGEICDPAEPIAFIHARNEADYEIAARRIHAAIEVGGSSEFAASSPIIKNFKV